MFRLKYLVFLNNRANDPVIYVVKNMLFAYGAFGVASFYFELRNMRITEWNTMYVLMEGLVSCVAASIAMVAYAKHYDDRAGFFIFGAIALLTLGVMLYPIKATSSVPILISYFGPSNFVVDGTYLGMLHLDSSPGDGVNKCRHADI